MNRYNIGRRIEAYREKRKMSTQELAGRIKRSQATISRIENGKQGLTFELLSSIAQELRVHPFALLSDEPTRAPVPASVFPPEEEMPEADESLLGRIRELYGLPVEEMRLLKEFLRILSLTKRK